MRTVWFDVEDLFDYFRGGHKRISGIQRLTFEIYRAAHGVGGQRVRFVRHGPTPLAFEVLEWAWIEAAFSTVVGPALDAPKVAGPVVDTQAAPEGDPGELAVVEPERSATRRAAARVVDLLPGRVRRPLVLAGVMQAQAVVEVGRFLVRVVRLGVRAVVKMATPAPRAVPEVRAALPPVVAEGPSFEDLARPGDVLLVLGSPWFRQEYSRLARWVRDERRMRFGVLVHDLVPLRRPEWSHSGVTRAFKDWYADVLPFCDLVLANSRSTAADVEAYAREIGVALPRAVRAVPVGTGFGPAVAAAHGPGVPGEYVLFVSTMEARKNHALVVKVWRRLLDEERAGVRAAGSVPELVFAGRVGWLVADLVQQLENTAWLGGRIRMVQDPSDAELRALYAGCLFTVFPSLHEGWGLPVTESLSLRTPCLSSDAGALPEAGGALCRYFDPEDVGSAQRAVAALLDDRAGLEAWRDQVRREFRPTAWTETAAAVLEEAGFAG